MWSPWCTWYAPMCCVMPPASPAATSVWRMASRSDVLPWSTWPRIVITGGRSSSAESSSTYSGSATTSSAACWISTFLSSPSARTSMASSESVWVRVAISPSSISFLMTSGGGTPSDSATSLTVAPDCTGETRTSSATSGLAVRSGSTQGVRRRRPRRRGGWFCCGGGPGARREACESMTTRRRRAPPPPPPPAGVGSVRVARCASAPFAVADAPSPLPLASSPALLAAAWASGSKARAMSRSSTLDAAAFTSRPAAWSVARTSLLGIPRSFAIS